MEALTGESWCSDDMWEALKVTILPLTRIYWSLTRIIGSRVKRCVSSSMR